MTDAILTVNAGSSSVKFALFAHEVGKEVRELARGQVESIGPSAHLTVAPAGTEKVRRSVEAPDHASALRAILRAADDVDGGRRVAGIGHRIVHGGPRHAAPALIDGQLLDDLDALVALAPLHQPHNLAAVRAACDAFPEAMQVACFDTGFHRGLAFEQEAFALPRRYYDAGIRRYGFHGLSYEFVSRELVRIAPEIAGGRVVIAHLGNGASMCAIREGRSVATTMGFSALDGLVMGTRCGLIDPGVLLYMMQTEGLDGAAISRLLYNDSGLKGLSGLSHDMRTLEASDAPEAAQAISCFVMRIRRELGSLVAALGGLDALVFTGGIGENSVRVRAEVCETMDWLGIAVDPAANAAGAMEIGAERVRVLVVPTDEERVIAGAVAALLR